MAGPKFFVFGGSRWRELDTTSGTVVGWGNVQFLSLRQGRLEVARKSSVLRGLRSLAASKATTVHDGPPLSQIRHSLVEKKKEDIAPPQQQHHCCCKQNNLCYNPDAIFNNLLKAATTTAAVQCSLTELNACIESKSQPNGTLINYSENQVKKLLAKRRRSSNDDNQLPRKNLKSTRSSDDSDSDIERSVLERKTVKSNEKGAVYGSKRNSYEKKKVRRSSTSSTSDSDDIPKLRRSQRQNLENRILDGNLLRNFSRNGDENNELNKNRSPQKSTENHTSTHLIKRKETRSSLKNKVTYLTNNEIDKELRAKRRLSDSEDFQDRKVRKTIGKNLRKRTEESERDDLCKELLISEEDIVLLRTFIEKDERNVFNVDLEKFDAQDSYKGLVFYKLNPLVNVERCKEIAKMLGQQPKDTITLEDFVSNLGLRSVLDTSSQASSKYKMRPRKSLNTPKKDTQKRSSESEPDKENFKKTQRSSTTSQNKVLMEKTKNKLKNTVTSKKVKKNAVGLVGKMSSKPVLKDDDVVSLSSDSDNVFRRSRRSEGRPKADMLKRNIEHSSRERRPSREENKTPSNSKKPSNKENNNKTSNDEKKRPSKEDNRTPSSSKKPSNKEDNKKTSGEEQKRPSRGEDKSKIEDNKKRSGETKRTEQSKGDKNSSGKEVKKPIRVSGKGSGREYTRAEDEVIVRWVAGSMRAKRVNGNQLWRELQSQYQEMTGQFRSWHSLRNRYLRYLLPALHNLDLPPPEAARLRAAAATGELKSRKKPQRRNSLLTEPPVRSAWTQRPRKSSPSPSPSPAPSPSRSRSLPATKTPSSSESDTSSGTRVTGESLVFQDRRSTLRKSTKEANDEEEAQPSRKLRSSIKPHIASPPTYSELTKRYADKQTPPHKETDKQTDTKRTRRLYNHAV